MPILSLAQARGETLQVRKIPGWGKITGGQITWRASEGEVKVSETLIYKRISENIKMAGVQSGWEGREGNEREGISKGMEDIKEWMVRY